MIIRSRKSIKILDEFRLWKKNEGLEDRLWQNSKIIARLASKWKKEADRLKQRQHQAN
jgi:hypothetical protein